MTEPVMPESAARCLDTGGPMRVPLLVVSRHDFRESS